MAKATSAGPASLDEGLNGIVSAISAAMTAPDVAGQQGQALMQLLQATIGIKKMGAGGGKPGGPPGGAPPGGAPPMGGGGTNLNQLMGGAPSGPSAGAGGGPSPTGMSADDMRQAVAGAG
jgi:hypothetical protein